MLATGKAKTVIWHWQERYQEAGIAGLWRDKTRPSRIPPLGPDVAKRVLALTLAGPPPTASHWTGTAMAKAVGISVSSVQRIWRAHGLQPHRMRQFKLSNDPQFAAKLHDIVGLYVDPPDHAIVLSVDEKSQIQALDRTQPGLQSLQPLEPSGDLDRYLLCTDGLNRDVWIGLGGFHLHQGPPLGRGRKRGAFNNAIGRSRGGPTTKIHALTDEIGRPHALLITAGSVHDVEGARSLLAMGHRPKRVLADRAYDARSLREELAQRRIKAVIPPNPTRKHPHRYDKTAYKGRNVIERMFCRLKDFRRDATRYDKRADIFPQRRYPHLVDQLSPDPNQDGAMPAASAAPNEHAAGIDNYWQE
jgi:transposase